MFSKLALKNTTRSIRDYMVYFLTLTFGVCLFYVFNSIDSQTAMLKISENKAQMLQNLSMILGYISVFISVVLGFLIVYANSFLIKRRKQELGIYMLLGMPKGKISRILILETFLIGVFSLMVGLVIGIFASQGLSVVTAKMFEADMTSFHFVFSPEALGKAILYFGVIFLVVMVFNTVSISRLKLIDLITAKRKNQTLRIKHLWMSVVIFILSVACLVAAYMMIIDNGLLYINDQFTASIILGSVGTLLFFLSLSGFLLRVVQSSKKLYYKGLNMFVLRQINSKINTTFVSMAVICLMLFFTIGVLSTGMGLANVISQVNAEAMPYSATLAYYPHTEVDYEEYPYSEEEDQRGLDIMGTIEKDGVNTAKYVEDSAQFASYDAPEGMTIGNFVMPDAPVPEVQEWEERQNIVPEVMSLSDYNRQLELQGKPDITLGGNEFALNCPMEELAATYHYYLQNDGTLNWNGRALKAVNQEVLTDICETSGNSYKPALLIVPDDLVQDLRVSKRVLNIQFKNSVDGEEFLKTLREFYLEDDSPRQPFSFYQSRQDMLDASVGSKTMISYVALYIGIVFLITSAAVLALQQLSDASDNVERYGLLRKLGAEEKMVNGALFKQIAIYFMLPLALAIVHSVVGISVANKVVLELGNLDILSNTIFTAVIFLLIYGGYFLATYFGSRAMIRPKRR